jgi:hypothetical protein
VRSISPSPRGKDHSLPVANPAKCFQAHPNRRPRGKDLTAALWLPGVDVLRDLRKAGWIVPRSVGRGTRQPRARSSALFGSPGLLHGVRTRGGTRQPRARERTRRTRELRPDMPILHVIHGSDSADGIPPDVPTLHEPFTPERLLTAVRGLLGR